mgnify:CR=1 FL=1
MCNFREFCNFPLTTRNVIIRDMYTQEIRPDCRICGAPAKKRGLCVAHYHRLRRSGEISIHRPTPLQVKLAKLLKNIRERCSMPTVKSYNRYGGRGITSSLTLDDLEFLWNRDEAWKLQRPSIDRHDNDGNYTRENCRFIEMIVNATRGKRLSGDTEHSPDSC